MKKGFLMEGPIIEVFQEHPMLGVKFISNGQFEYIGNITEIRDGIAIVDDPVIITRDSTNPSKFIFTPFNKANPIVQKRIEVPVYSILFFCTPADPFIRNYNAAKAGLVNAPG